MQWTNQTLMCKAREKVWNKVAIGFSFASDWLRNWSEIFQPITDEVKQNESKRKLLSTLS